MEHPFRFVLFLLLAGISTLFLGLVGAFFYSTYVHEQPAIIMPWPFVLSTVVIIYASWLFEKARKSFTENNFTSLYRQIQIIIGASLTFTGLQVYGWYTLFTAGLEPAHSQGAGYLYVISGLHLLHILLGIPFMLSFIRRLFKAQKEEHRREIFMIEEKNKYRLDNLARYWHFLDGLWIILILVFAIQQLIKGGLHSLL